MSRSRKHRVRRSSLALRAAPIAAVLTLTVGLMGAGWHIHSLQTELAAIRSDQAGAEAVAVLFKDQLAACTARRTSAAAQARRPWTDI